MIKRRIIAAAAVVLIASALLTGCGGAKKAAAPAVKLTKAQFDKANLGMNYDEVQKAVGGPGNVTTEEGTPGQPGYTLVVEYPGVKEGGLARFTFKNGQLINKGGSGLE
ncbi:hypothetical protein O9H85_18470 [Paenibacillus filicis]|uniref:Beta-lactamase inhibitor (BLIP) n=1 Tax=Paenibacillus gyeongsangnamensis TaxID=3388067 RepID=A0ABT4QBV6_9BACL|nr:hypothetical protein [Paenibacillus filicis]MCZ8514369.1 hypothetical protein [Paenibacillus filicis]